MNLNKSLIVLYIFIFFSICITLGIYINFAQVSQQMLIDLDQQVISLQDDKQALQDEINTITGRTLQLWLVNENGELIPLGSTRFFRELIPENPNLFTEDLGNGIGFTGNRIDIYLPKESIHQ